MKIKYIDGDIRIGNIYYKYINEDSDNIYCLMGRYKHKKKTIYIIKQKYFLITICIFIHEYIHLLIRYIFNKENAMKVNIIFHNIDYNFKKYIIRHRPKAEDIIYIQK